MCSGAVLQPDFERGILRGRDFTARNNAFVIPPRYGGVHVCDDCSTVASVGTGCFGDRSENPSIVVEDNVLDAYYGSPGVSGAPVFEIDRVFGPIDSTDNDFVGGLPPYTDTWDGAPDGCAA